MKSESLPQIVDEVLEAQLRHDPVEATFLGDHRRDGDLGDPFPAAVAARISELRSQLGRLDRTDPSTSDEQVDAAVLHTALSAQLFDLETLREPEWNPMVHNPGLGLYALTAREFAPLEVRAEALISRVGAIPEYLAAARETLGEMSAVHLRTAHDQLHGTEQLLGQVIPATLAPLAKTNSEAVLQAGQDAVAQHREWLAAREPAARRDPRLGEQAFAAKLALALDTEIDPAALLAQAEADLERVSAEIVAEAGRLAGSSAPDVTTVGAVLDRLAVDAPNDQTILRLCETALQAATRFVAETDLVTIFDDPIAVVEMPEIDRGVAVAYCRPSGPLEATALPTELAVSPTPAGWNSEQVASFYREYNTHMLHDLVVHEAMPGHALQLSHSNRHRGTTPVRRVWWSGTFVEGWAVYSEELMVDAGYRGSTETPAEVRIQQLKMQLRMIINAIMDIRFHTGDLDERGALDLMTRRGFQEQGEALGKWRRVQLTATQLCTYYVGYLEVRQLAAALRVRYPQWSSRQLHDAILGAGSPPARHLYTLLGA